MNLPKEELEKFSLEDKVVSKYMGKLNRINEDPVFLNLIDYEEDNKRLMNSMKREAREAGYEEGREKRKGKIKYSITTTKEKYSDSRDYRNNSAK